MEVTYRISTWNTKTWVAVFKLILGSGF